MSTSDAIRIANQITANWSQTDYYQFAFDRLVDELINGTNGECDGYLASTETGTDAWEPTEIFG